MALKHYQEALRSDPENEECSWLIRSIKKSQDMKENGGKLFKD